MSHGSKERRNKIVPPDPRHKKDYCEGCGIKNSKVYNSNGFLLRKGSVILTIHHIDHNPWNNDPSNLQTLCRKCHTEVHRYETYESTRRA